MQIHRLGILRTLWQKPDVMMITSCEGQSLDNERDFHSRLNQFCQSSGIRLILLTTQNTLGQEDIWSHQINLGPWLQVLDEAN